MHIIHTYTTMCIFPCIYIYMYQLYYMISLHAYMYIYTYAHVSTYDIYIFNLYTLYNAGAFARVRRMLIIRLRWCSKVQIHQWWTIWPPPPAIWDAWSWFSAMLTFAYPYFFFGCPGLDMNKLSIRSYEVQELTFHQDAGFFCCSPKTDFSRH